MTPDSHIDYTDSQHPALDNYLYVDPQYPEIYPPQAWPFLPDFWRSETSREDPCAQIPSILSPFSGNSPRVALEIPLWFTLWAFHLCLTVGTHNIMRSCFTWLTSQHSPILSSQKGSSYQKKCIDMVWRKTRKGRHLPKSRAPQYHRASRPGEKKRRKCHTPLPCVNKTILICNQVLLKALEYHLSYLGVVDIWSAFIPLGWAIIGP